MSHRVPRAARFAPFPAALLACLMAAAPALATGPVTRRVSIDSAEMQANGASGGPALSATGRVVAFASAATNLVDGDTNGVADVFVRDRGLGKTERVSVRSAEVQATGGYSGYPAISADGRFVAFYSEATDLVPNDTNGLGDIFVRDRQLGTTRRVNISSSEAQGLGGPSYNPSISADGRYVAFQSSATNLIAHDTNSRSDVFVRDRQLGTTRRVSISSAEVQGDEGSSAPSISADGRFVAFDSEATNLVLNDTNGVSDVFVRDIQLGTTTRVSRSSAGAQAVGGYSDFPSISADGRYVAFPATSTGLVANDTNGTEDIFVHDRQMGTTSRVSVSSGETQATGGISYYASISADGRYVTFQSFATDLIADDTNGSADIFVRDRQLGTTVRVSVDNAGIQVNGNSIHPAISANGRFVGFQSVSFKLTANDTNGVSDVFLRGPLH